MAFLMYQNLYVFHGATLSQYTGPVSMTLVGFCGASMKAYAMVVYLRIESKGCVNVQFLTADTSVTAW